MPCNVRAFIVNTIPSVLIVKGVVVAFSHASWVFSLQFFFPPLLGNICLEHVQALITRWRCVRKCNNEDEGKKGKEARKHDNLW